MIVIHSKIINIIIITNDNVIVMLMILSVLWETYIPLFDFLHNYAAGSKVTTKYFNLFLCSFFTNHEDYYTYVR
jgi:hypothetical protein